MAFIVDYRIKAKEYGNLRELGDVILSDQTEAGAAINGHPDLQLHVLDQRIFVYKGISRRLSAEIQRATDKSVILTNSEIRQPYPHDVHLNAVSTPEYFIHHTGQTDPLLLAMAKESGRQIIHLKQGYARCTILPVNETAFITNDRKAAISLKRSGAACLYLPPGDIRLTGYEHGFIGGSAAFVKQPEELYLVTLGDMERYRHYGEIVKFLKGLGIKYTPFPLSPGPLEDMGGILQI